ncbi:MAG: BON domain-containing protein, partial [Phycisphaerales bacterium]
MRRSQQHSKFRVRTVVAAILVAALCTGLALAAYDDDQSSQQGQQSWQQGQNQDRQQSSMQSQDQDQGSWQQQGQRSGMSQGRNQQIERQVANELRQQGFGQNGQIMVLAIGDRVILLGTVPDQQQKDQIDQAANQVSGVQQVDNRLHVSTGSARQNDSQLRRQIEQQLRNQTAAGQNVQVQVRNGRVTLNGQVDNWQEVADVLDTAFASGARNVTSQLNASQGQSAMSQSDRGYQSGMGQDQWQGQQGAGQSSQTNRGYQSRMGQQDMGQSSQTDRGYYPPYGYTPGQGDQSQWQDQSGYGQQRQGRMGQGRQQWEQQSGTGMQQQGGQQMSASDLALAQRVAMQLQQQLGTAKTVHVMDPRAIYIHVSQGTVKLHGAVQDNSQRQQAEQIARSVRGVQNVQNQLRIAGQDEEYQTFGYVPGQSSQSQGRSQWGSGSQQGQTGSTSGTSGTSGQSDQESWGTSGSGQDSYGSTSGQSNSSQSGTGSSGQSQFGSSG